MTYDEVHRYLVELRGKASAQICPCGEKAVAWAYQYTGTEIRPEGESPYSEDPNDYAAMCSSCHARLDWEDPLRRAQGEAVLRTNAKTAGTLGGKARAARQKSDREYAERMRQHGRWLGKTRGGKGGKARAARYYSDPEYAKVVRASAAKAREAKARKRNLG